MIVVLVFGAMYIFGKKTVRFSPPLGEGLEGEQVGLWKWWSPPSWYGCNAVGDNYCSGDSKGNEWACNNGIETYCGNPREGTGRGGCSRDAEGYYCGGRGPS